MAREFGRPSSFKHVHTDDHNGNGQQGDTSHQLPTAHPVPSGKLGSEILRAFPVLFVVLVVVCVYTIFVALDLPSSARNPLIFQRGVIETAVFHVMFILFVICYILVVVTPAGTIPNRLEWFEGGEEEEGTHLERKREGTRRFCKWCDKYKPDRAHHCRQCRLCVLKMDHHCPWIYNCVGWRNHKYFILTLLYSSITTGLVTGFQLESVIAAIDAAQIRFGVLLLLFFGESLAGFLTLLSVTFFCFHFWLVIRNLSTIEFCEKRYRRTSVSNIYHHGWASNLGDIFGRNPLLWLLPIDNRRGDGLHFKVNREAEQLLCSSKDTLNETGGTFGGTHSNPKKVNPGVK